LARSKIKHIIVIVQKNRSFDQYFGTYPGANGIPMHNGMPTVCALDPQTGQCIKPCHDSSNINAGGLHSSASTILDIDGERWMASWKLFELP
jgi:phospholipase C